MSRDQQTLQTDQATLDQDQATLAGAQNDLSDAQQAAANLAQQADQAEAKAQQDIAQQQQQASAAELTLTNAQNQLQYDQNQWNEGYQTTLASIRSHNARLTSCQTQARDHFTAAGIVAILGGILTALIWWRRRPKANSELPTPATG